jgi:hypothetical protein
MALVLQERYNTIRARLQNYNNIVNINNENFIPYPAAKNLTGEYTALDLNNFMNNEVKQNTTRRGNTFFEDYDGERVKKLYVSVRSALRLVRRSLRRRNVAAQVLAQVVNPVDPVVPPVQEVVPVVQDVVPVVAAEATEAAEAAEVPAVAEVQPVQEVVEAAAVEVPVVPPVQEVVAAVEVPAVQEVVPVVQDVPGVAEEDLDAVKRVVGVRRRRTVKVQEPEEEEKYTEQVQEEEKSCEEKCIDRTLGCKVEPKIQVEVCKRAWNGRVEGCCKASNCKGPKGSVYDFSNVCFAFNEVVVDKKTGQIDLENTDQSVRNIYAVCASCNTKTPYDQKLWVKKAGYMSV